MADRGRPIPTGAAIYASAHKAVQPPDDRTYSAEVTVFQRNLPHHRSARAESPYTRSYIIPPRLRIVKQNFRKNHKRNIINKKREISIKAVVSVIFNLCIYYNSINFYVYKSMEFFRFYARFYGLILYSI